MRLSIVAVSVALLAGVSACSRSGGLLRSFDPLESCSTVGGRVLTHAPVDGRVRLTLDAFAMHRGEAPTEPMREATFSIAAEHDPDTDVLGLESPELELVMDNSVVLRYDGRAAPRPFPASHVRGGVNERVYFRVPAADLRRIARAGAVRGRVGALEMTLREREMAILRRLAAIDARAPHVEAPRDGRFDHMDSDSYPWSPNLLPYERAK